MTAPVQFWSCGGGTQSAAIAALICQGKFPKPDIAAIADTGREIKATWKYLDEVLRPALWKACKVEIERIPKDKWQTADSPDVLTNWGDQPGVLIPAFKLTEKGTRAKMMGRCSDRWKTQVLRRWIRSLGVERCDAWLGMSTDEGHRLRVSGLQWYQHRYPLYFDIPLRRSGCISLVMDQMGWPEPPRSACFMCPNRHSSGWLAMKRNDPEEFAEAVAFERWLQAERPGHFLHESLKPLDEIDFEALATQESMFTDNSCSSGYCFV